MTDKIRINHETVVNPLALEALLNAIYTEVTALRTLANEIKTDMTAHTHGGVTAGAASTSAGATLSSATVVQKAVAGK
jgi:hypothetical protein